jgi:tetratricopeptide (TPR) repeat protein
MFFLPGFLLFLSLLSSPELNGHEGDDQAVDTAPGSGRVLGKISFPTTTQSTEAQQAFIEGMLLLHLFEYPFARDQFLKAQQIDSGFTMAYWGEAMTHNHPIWDRQDLQAGRDALLKLGASPEQRLATTAAAREQGFLAAVELLYGPGTKAQRDLAYMRAMEQLALRYPQDHEVQLFYALSLFGVHAGVRDTASYMMSTAIAQDVFSENPQHPGAAHYLIHGVDDPVHAVLGLRAARSLAVMAPDAGHSQHMTSHIFTAVGMWDDVVTANEAAVEVQNRMRGEKGMVERHWGHYNYWLLYGYLQQGRFEKALERYVIETRGWSGEVAGWSFNTGKAFDPNLTVSFIRALQAADSSMAAEAGQYTEQFKRLKFELEGLISRQDEKAPTDLLYLDRLEVMELELLAFVELARGEKNKAVQFLQRANSLEGDMPFSFGPPFVDLPSAEFLGDLLTQTGKYADAVAAYETQLQRSHQKSRSLMGLSRAQSRIGKDAAAAYNRQKLEAVREQLP